MILGILTDVVSFENRDRRHCTCWHSDRVCASWVFMYLYIGTYLGTVEHSTWRRVSTSQPDNLLELSRGTTLKTQWRNFIALQEFSVNVCRHLVFTRMVMFTSDTLTRAQRLVSGA